MRDAVISGGQGGANKVSRAPLGPPSPTPPSRVARYPSVHYTLYTVVETREYFPKYV